MLTGLHTKINDFLNTSIKRFWKKFWHYFMKDNHNRNKSLSFIGGFKTLCRPPINGMMDLFLAGSELLVYTVNIHWWKPDFYFLPFVKITPASQCTSHCTVQSTQRVLHKKNHDPLEQFMQQLFNHNLTWTQKIEKIQYNLNIFWAFIFL